MKVMLKYEGEKNLGPFKTYHFEHTDSKFDCVVLEDGKLVPKQAIERLGFVVIELDGEEVKEDAKPGLSVTRRK